MPYIALKPCTFAGQRYKIGETVPDEVLHPGAIKNLVKMQIVTPADAITEAKTAQRGPIPIPPINITIRRENGDIELNLSDIGLQQIFDVLTSNASNAEKIVKTISDGDALILLHMSDSRKTIKEAAEARAKELEEDSAGEE